jgi:catechol 2,3-dioxygenase-like lactoylglutathione lyase family enzyme
MQPPAVKGILETSLYVASLEKSIAFYESIFNFPILYSDHRMYAMNVAPQQVLLLFLKGASAKASHTPGGLVPPSDGDGHLHLAFSVTPEELDNWKAWLQEQQVEIESTVQWKAGGTSIYFRDPDEHLVELATPGLWANY